MAPATTLSDYGCPADNGYVTYASYVVLQYESAVSFTNDPDPYFEWSCDGDEAQTVTNVSIGDPYYPQETSQTVTLNLGYLYSPGVYEVSVPAGILKNEDGDVNPAQTVTFTIVAGSLYGSGDDFKVTPAKSESAYDYDTGNAIPAPFYKAEELSNVTIGWEGYVLESMGVDKIACYDSDYNYAYITDFEFVDGSLVLDLSDFSDGSWTITLPTGFAKATKDGQVYLTSSVYIPYTILSNPSEITEYTVYNPREGSYYLSYLSDVQVGFGQPVKIVEGAPEATYTYNGATHPLATSIISDYQGYKLRLAFDGYQEEPGLYEINIPAGLVTNGEYSNSDITLEYRIVTTVNDFVATPADKTTLSAADFDNIKITFPNATKIEPNTKTWAPIVVRGGTYGNYIYNYNLDIDNGVAIDGNTITLTLPEVNQVSYWVNIDGMNFIIDDNYTNNYIYLEYTVWDGLPAATVIQAPNADLLTASSNSVVVMTWDYQPLVEGDNFSVKLETGYQDPVDVPEGSVAIITIENPDADAEPAENNALLVDLSAALNQYFSDPYNYTRSFKLTIPAGVVKNEAGLQSAFAEFSFRAYPDSPVDAKLQETAQEGLYYIVWDNLSWMGGIQYGCQLTLTDFKGTKTTLYESYSDTPASGTFCRIYDPLCIAFNVSELPASYYTLTMPEGIVMFNIDGDNTDYVPTTTFFNLKLGDGGLSGVELPEGDAEVTDGPAFNISWNKGEKVALLSPETELVFGTSVQYAYINVSVADEAPQAVKAVVKNDEGVYSLCADLADVFPAGIPFDEAIVFDIPEGIVANMNGDINPAQQVSYEMSSVLEGVVENDGTVKVYNLQGIKVLEGSKDLRGLQPGIYIVNGRKVYIGK